MLLGPHCASLKMARLAATGRWIMVGHCDADLGSRCHYSYGPHIALACSCGPIMMIQMLMECIGVPLGSSLCKSENGQTGRDVGRWIMVGHCDADLGSRCHYLYGPHIALACSCGPIMMIQMLMECIGVPLGSSLCKSENGQTGRDVGRWIMVGHCDADLGSTRCHYSYGPHIALACSCGPIMMIQKFAKGQDDGRTRQNLVPRKPSSMSQKCEGHV